MSEIQFDLSFNPTDETGLRVEVISRRKGYIATMVDSNLRDMSMCRVSRCTPQKSQ